MSFLFSPLRLRGVTLKNRVVLGPMCVYSARDGQADDYHLVHLGRFALGGFGVVMTEAVAVSPEGRISHGCLGLWNDEQAESLSRICRFLTEHGAVPAIQLSHAGRKGSSRRPWRGEGTVTKADFAELGDAPWSTVAPSAVEHSGIYARPSELDLAGMARIADDFRRAARRALEAGFKIIEVHLAHGYLLNQFLSPIANKRQDHYGGGREKRMRWPLQIVAGIRESWPGELPVFVRISASDNIAGGWDVSDSVCLALQLKAIGVDVIVCSSGGFHGARGNAFTENHLPYAKLIRREAGIATMAAGGIVEPRDAEAILDSNSADLVALARRAMTEPHWPMTAAAALDGKANWPPQVAWAL
jgi:2,4-dienoyl-CoA reductase-like NADH-dependent reductase (Old Yellow Enzyme family)